MYKDFEFLFEEIPFSKTLPKEEFRRRYRLYCAVKKDMPYLGRKATIDDILLYVMKKMENNQPILKQTNLITDSKLLETETSVVEKDNKKKEDKVEIQNHQFNLLLTESLFEDLACVADMQGKSLNDMLNLWLKEAVEVYRDEIEKFKNKSLQEI